VIKLGSVSFMNAKPLTFALENGLVEHGFDIKLTPPSDLSLLLSRKEIDLGLIPVAEFLRRKSYSAVPGISISSYGKVDSVVLLSKGEITDIKRVAVDRRSQSSTALLRIILETFHNLSPVYLPTTWHSNWNIGVKWATCVGVWITWTSGSGMAWTRSWSRSSGSHPVCWRLAW